MARELESLQTHNKSDGAFDKFVCLTNLTARCLLRRTLFPPNLVSFFLYYYLFLTSKTSILQAMGTLTKLIVILML